MCDKCVSLPNRRMDMRLQNRACGAVHHLTDEHRRAGTQTAVRFVMIVLKRKSM